MTFRAFVFVLFIASAALAADAPSTSPSTSPSQLPRPANVDPAAWDRMLDIDARAAKIDSLIADFQQQKFTAMLKKPLISSGKIYVRGSAMLWDTSKPEPTALQLTASEARIYYPKQKTIEVYQLREKLTELAASPVPRLAVLTQHFSFEPIAIKELGETDDTKFFAVKMTPTDADMREHVEQVRVLLDAQRGLIMRLEMSDTDGDRTIVTFSNVQINAPLRDEDLALHAPPDVKITRPLAGIEGSPPPAKPSPQGSSDRK